MRGTLCELEHLKMFDRVLIRDKRKNVASECLFVL